MRDPGTGVDEQTRLHDEARVLVAVHQVGRRGAEVRAPQLVRALVRDGLPRPRAQAAVRRLRARRLLVPRSPSVLSRLLPSLLVPLAIPPQHEPVVAAMAWSRSLTLDLDVIVEIYEGPAGSQVNGGIRVSQLLARMRERGVADARLVLKALDILFDRGMLKTDDSLTGAPTILVAGEAEKFVAFLSAQRRARDSG